MPKKILLILSALSGLIFMSPSYSLIIGGDDVGGVDSVVGVSNLNNADFNSTWGSGEAGELNWVNSLVDPDFTSLYKTGGDIPWTGLDVDNLAGDTFVDGFEYISFALDTGPGYYIVKNSNYRALILNEVSLDFGVLEVGADDASNELYYFFSSLGDDFIISHVSEFGGASVPEPSILALMGLGILGLGLSRRRMKR